MENDDIFAKIKFLLFSWVPPFKICFRPLCQMLNNSVEKLHSTIQQAPTITEWINLSTTHNYNISLRIYF